jgi:hypothetical protein
MRPVDHSKVQGHYVEVTKPGEDDADDPLASFFLNNSGGVSGVGGSGAADFFKEFGNQLADDVPVQWLNQPAEGRDNDENDDGLSDDDDFDPDDASAKWVQRDPRQS